MAKTCLLRPVPCNWRGPSLRLWITRWRHGSHAWLEAEEPRRAELASKDGTHESGPRKNGAWESRRAGRMAAGALAQADTQCAQACAAGTHYSRAAPDSVARGG